MLGETALSSPHSLENVPAATGSRWVSTHLAEAGACMSWSCSAALSGANLESPGSPTTTTRNLSIYKFPFVVWLWSYRCQFSKTVARLVHAVDLPWCQGCVRTTLAPMWLGTAASCGTWTVAIWGLATMQKMHLSSSTQFHARSMVAENGFVKMPNIFFCIF